MPVRRSALTFLPSTCRAELPVPCSPSSLLLSSGLGADSRHMSDDPTCGPAHSVTRGRSAIKRTVPVPDSESGLPGQRLTGPAAPRRRAASRPSRNSSEAPPPVETWANRPSQPELVHERDGLTATDDDGGVRLREEAGEVLWSRARTPPTRRRRCGPFQTTVLRPRSFASYAGTVFGPMSRIIQPAGTSSSATVRDGASSAKRSATTASTGRPSVTLRRAASAMTSRACL